MYNWIYQLQDINPEAVAATGASIKVIDPTSDGFVPFTRDEVTYMRASTDTRILAYLSIGEAEDYRGYWDPKWKTNPPDWLEKQNPEWHGNYKVCFWHPKWQAIVKMQLDAIVAAGFDGVYLDIIDGYEYWANEHATSARDMADLIKDIKTRSGLMVVPQNGEGLIEDYGYDILSIVDGWAIEDLYYGDPTDGEPNANSRTRERLRNINQVIDAGKPVLLVEYPNRAYWGQAQAQADSWFAYGMTPYLTTRDLNKLTEPL